jgi:cell division septum initiation protein DivIVA
MTQVTPNFDKATQAATLIPSELLDIAKKRIETLFDAQKDLLQTLEGINHEFFSRAKKEAELASEFVGNLASARSVPDATTTYREWATKEMELLAADGRQMFAHGEKIMQASQRLFSSSSTTPTTKVF